MLDINFLRQSQELVKKATKNKGYNPEVVEQVLKLDKKRRQLLRQVEDLRAERNKIIENLKSPSEMSKLKELKRQAKELKNKLKNIEPQLKKVEKDFQELLLRLPNLPAPDVPEGKNEKDNVVLRKWGKPRKFDFKVRDHLEIGEALEIIDVKRAAKVSGTRFAYLKNEGVFLEFALVQFALETLLQEGFIPIIPPVLIRKEAMRGMGYLEHGGEEDMFILERDNLVLVGTSEQAIGPLHLNEVFRKEDLPRRYLGFSSCFRREAGSYGKDTRGILRVHQFDKLEMFSFTTPQKSDQEHEYLLSLEERLFQALEIPYRVVKMCTADLGAPAARKYDLEAWLPGQNRYREVTSCSTTTDFQARRLNIKYQEGGRRKYVHMLNATAFAIGRTIIAILENYQQKDGSVSIPQVLQKYLRKKYIRREES